MFNTKQNVISAYKQNIISKDTYDHFISLLKQGDDFSPSMSTINFINSFIDNFRKMLKNKI